MGFMCKCVIYYKLVTIMSIFKELIKKTNNSSHFMSYKLNYLIPTFSLRNYSQS